MPALSFSGETSRGPFYQLILDGEKKQTVRLPRKRPIKQGDFLRLYWKQRTPKDKKPIHFIGPAKCTHVETVRKYNFLFNREFARRDGFSDELELQEWFGLDNDDALYTVIHFKLIRSCMGCSWCQPLRGVYVCAQNKGRYSIVEGKERDPRYLGCYEVA